MTENEQAINDRHMVRYDRLMAASNAPDAVIQLLEIALEMNETLSTVEMSRLLLQERHESLRQVLKETREAVS